MEIKKTKHYIICPSDFLLTLSGPTVVWRAVLTSKANNISGVHGQMCWLVGGFYFESQIVAKCYVIGLAWRTVCSGGVHLPPCFGEFLKFHFSLFTVTPPPIKYLLPPTLSVLDSAQFFELWKFGLLTYNVYRPTHMHY